MLKPPIPVDDSQRADDLRRLDIMLTEPEAELDRVTRELARIFDVPGAYLSFIDEDTQYYKSYVGELPEPYAETRTEPRAESLCSYVVGLNEEMVVEDMLEDDRFRDDPAVLAFGVRFYAGAPLRAESGRAVGTMCILDSKPRRMTERERELLRLVAEGAMAMVRLQTASRKLAERTRQIDADLRQAVEVQRFMLPPGEAAGDGWRMEHLYRPYDHLGGDFIDWYERSDGRWALIIADVSGHGTSAALTTAMAKTAFRRAAVKAADPAELLSRVHAELCGAVVPGQFITGIAGLFDPGTRVLSFCSAGHPEPLLVRGGSGGVQYIEHRGELPLCVERGTRYKAMTDVRLATGDRVMMYTDGAIEARDASGEMLGMEGLARLAGETAGSTGGGEGGASLVRAVLEGVLRFGGGSLDDDIALLSIEAG